MPRSLIVWISLFSTCLLFSGMAMGQGVESECDAVPDNIVANCGFETVANPYGDPPEWTSSGFFYHGVDRHAHSGNFGMFMFGDRYTGGCISQTLTTVPDQSYDLSYWFTCDFTADVEVLWNDARIDFQSLTDFPPYLRSTVGGLIGTGTDTLKFCNGSYPYGYLWLDDIVVIPSPASP